MKKVPAKRPITKAKRRSMGADSREWVSIRRLHEDKPYPTLITPKIGGLGLAQWAADNADFVQELWEEKRSLLFRDFELGGMRGFQDLVEATAEGPCLPYLNRSTPRKEYAPNIYCTTIYPSELAIRLHNEGSYWAVHPQKAYFACVTAPTTGGETPIGDVHAVYNRIDPQIREEFASRKWMLLRNYNDGFSLPWQEVFQTDDRAEVESYCRENRIEFEWGDGEHLRTRQVREPILRHPRTGEMTWHNHIAFFHITSREAAVRDALQQEFRHDELPYNTYYGDGGPIDPEVIRHINDAYDAELIKFTWQQGDVHLIDNIRIAHAREPFTGDRLILVALTEAYAPPRK